jgi:hypothetical protein
MFWNDPNLYGATFKDVAKEPLLPWMNAPWNVPRFAPPTFGYLPPSQIQHFAPPVPPFVPPTYGYLPPTPIQAFAPPINPFVPATMLHPYAPPTSFSPLTLPYGLNPPVYGFYRPYTF